jgi:hypothetical protein
MGVVLEEEVVVGLIDVDGLRGIPPEIYARTPVDVVENTRVTVINMFSR